jgi:hypothetical protein
MRSRGTWFLTGAFLFSVVAGTVCLMPGCGESNETGTTVIKSKQAAEAEKKSMEGMKAMMEKFPKATKKRR